MTGGKLFITGGIGSRYDGESFGESYELPADQCYCETCAAIGSFFWNWRMLLISGDSRYANLMERLMYNGILSSPGLDGTSYFYVNPLMLRNGRYVRLSTNPGEEHRTPTRPKWHSVACCPPNVMRLFASLPSYFASRSQMGIQIHQYGNMEVSAPLDEQASVRFRIATTYPWEGKVRITMEQSDIRPWKLSLRLPDWCQSFSIKVNEGATDGVLQKGYVTLERIWAVGDIVEADFSMPAVLVAADPRVDSLRGCVAIQRGPLVYCLEEQDQDQGVSLLDVKIDPSTALMARWQEDLLGGILILEGAGFQMDRANWAEGRLYHPLRPRSEEQQSDSRIKLVAIPYYAWGNRGLKSMRVWIPCAQDS